MAKIDERKRSMASQRTPEQLKTIILKATQHLVAVGGMQNFSYPKLAAETGINAPTVYEHYKNKEALLTACFLTIDDEIACKIANAPKNLSAGVKDLQSLDNLCWLLWLPYWNYLTADYDRTLFYWHFCNSEYYTPTVMQQRMQNGKAFWELVQSVNGLSQFSERCNLEMLVWNLVDNTVAMAAKVLRGVYPNDEVNVNTVYHMVFQPVFSAFGQNSGDDNKADGK